MEEFRRIVRTYRPLFIQPGGLRPTDRVLEVGSGIGRMAQAVCDYLTPPGGYDGIEVAQAGVKWCVENITPHLPNFRFHHADLYNQVYNPGGRWRARTYRFPFPAGTFDFVLLTSVFTHLLPRDAAHYLDEIARVLKPGGRVFATFFLVSDERVRIIRTGSGKLLRAFQRYGKPPLGDSEGPGYGDCFIEYVHKPEWAVGFEERWVYDQFRSCGLTPDTDKRYGHWDGRPSVYDGQDVVCATKTGSPSLARRVRTTLRMDGLREMVWQRRRPNRVD